MDNIYLEKVILASQPPDAINDEASTHTDTPVVIDVLANDTDPNDDIDPATVIIATNAANGSTVVGGDGRITYTPFAGYAGGDSFTYTVADSSGLRSNQATVNLTVSDQTTFFSDDFVSSGSISGYTVTYTQLDGGVGQLLYDSAGQRALVKTGDNVGLALSRSITPSSSGTFSVDFLPIKKYPAGGILNLKLSQDQNNYYQVYVTDGYAAGSVRKYVNGIRVDSSNFVQGYSQNNSYGITIHFSPKATIVEAFGQIVIIEQDVSNILINSFSIDLSQQDAYLDNISLESGGPYVLITSPASYDLQTTTDLPVEAIAIQMDSGWTVEFVLDQGTADQRTIIDTTSPYAVTFYRS